VFTAKEGRRRRQQVIGLNLDVEVRAHSGRRGPGWAVRRNGGRVADGVADALHRQGAYQLEEEGQARFMAELVLVGWGRDAHVDMARGLDEREMFIKENSLMGLWPHALVAGNVTTSTSTSTSCVERFQRQQWRKVVVSEIATTAPWGPTQSILRISSHVKPR
jgi:hypothetical protein